MRQRRGLHGIESVSYTHLDVYKRQMHPELARFLHQLARMALACAVVIATFVFVTMPWSLGRLPGGDAPARIERHMTCLLYTSRCV